MAFNRDTPQVKEWMADYFDGKISGNAAARLDVGGQEESLAPLQKKIVKFNPHIERLKKYIKTR